MFDLFDYPFIAATVTDPDGETFSKAWLMAAYAVSFLNPTLEPEARLDAFRFAYCGGMA